MILKCEFNATMATGGEESGIMTLELFFAAAL